MFSTLSQSQSMAVSEILINRTRVFELNSIKLCSRFQIMKGRSNIFLLILISCFKYVVIFHFLSLIFRVIHFCMHNFHVIVTDTLL